MIICTNLCVHVIDMNQKEIMGIFIQFYLIIKLDQRH